MYTTIYEDFDFTELINNVICDCAERLEDGRYSIYDITSITNDLLDYDFRNGSYYCNAFKARRDIFNNFDIITEIVREKEEEGVQFTNIFDSEETFHLEILYCGVEARLNCKDVADFLEGKSEEQENTNILFDADTIDEFKKLFVFSD